MLSDVNLNPSFQGHLHFHPLPGLCIIHKHYTFGIELLLFCDVPCPSKKAPSLVPGMHLCDNGHSRPVSRRDSNLAGDKRHGRCALSGRPFHYDATMATIVLSSAPRCSYDAPLPLSFLAHTPPAVPGTPWFIRYSFYPNNRKKTKSPSPLLYELFGMCVFTFCARIFPFLSCSVCVMCICVTACVLVPGAQRNCIRTKWPYTSLLSAYRPLAPYITLHQRAARVFVWSRKGLRGERGGCLWNPIK